MESPLILLIDDDPLCNFVASLTLNHLNDNVLVKSCLSAKEGLKILQIAEKKDHLPSLILLDINMPEMNGWSFIEEYRQIKPEKEIPIIILTSSVYQDDKKKASQYEEVVSYLTKPLKIEDLEEIKEQGLL